MNVQQMAFTPKQDDPSYVIEWRPNDSKDFRGVRTSRRSTEIAAIKRAETIRNEKGVRVDVWKDSGNVRDLIYVAEPFR